MSKGFSGAIDVVCNFEFMGETPKSPEWRQQFITQKIGGSPDRLAGIPVEAYLDKMDRAGIEHAFLIAVKAGSSMDSIHWRIPYEKVADMVARYPSRFSGLAGIDPTEGMAGVRDLEHAVKELGFIGAHLYPHWFGLAPDAARFYPFYAKCVELDIPIQMQVGHCLRYSKARPLKSVGRPITLDTVACDFPDLKLIGIHMGWPWTEEMIAVAYKHPNVYIGSDAYAPRHWPKEFVNYIDSWGQDKVLFGTDFPVIDPEDAMDQIQDLAIRPSSRQKFLRTNAMELYGEALTERLK